MNLVELTEQDKERYNAFVANSIGGSFLQAWEWGEWQKNQGNKVARVALMDEDEIVATAQCVRMDMGFGKHYVYIPYGPVTDFRFKIFLSAIASAEAEDLRFFLDQLKQKFPSAVFVRVEPQEKLNGLENLAKKTVNIQPGITMVVDIKKTDDEILAAMHPKTRYNIKIAQRHGVDVQSELVVTPRYGLYVQEAIQAIVDTQVRQNYRGHPFEYYKKLIDFFALNNAKSDLKVIIYKALYQKKLIASGIMVDFGKTRMYLYGGSTDEDKNLMAPYLMHWQAMQDARNLGLEFYDLCGSEVASGGERGFTRFKKGFGGRVVEYAGAYDVIYNKLWYNGYRIVRQANRLLKQITK
jgi:lipid II:glycine glycyltransferase (peptidoglycan interpeptide bridge formation enzyme)